MNRQIEAMFNDSSFIAPRSYYRRLGRFYFLPANHLFAGIFLIFLASYTGTRDLFSIFLFVLIFIAYLADDLSTPTSLVHIAYIRCCELLRLEIPYAADSNNQLVYSIYSPPPLVDYRRQIRWASPLITYTTSYGYIIYLIILGRIRDNVPNLQTALIVSLVVVISTIPYGLLLETAFISNDYRRRMWLIPIISGFGMACAIIAFLYLTQNVTMTLLATATHLAHAIFIFVTFRLNVGRRKLSDILKNMIFEATEWHKGDYRVEDIPKKIGGKLHYDRVCVLKVSADQKRLQVIGAYGDFPENLIGVEVLIDKSLTGRAYQTNQPVCWNDISVCDYYTSPFSDDDTAAEIAVPILYQGEIYGILDVQSNRANIFGPSDVKALESVGRTLGLAMALEVRNKYFNQVMDLSHEFAFDKARTYASEEIAVELFSNFAHTHLNADVITYYPLTVAGRPMERPFISGEIPYHSLFDIATRDPDSPLLFLIEEWKPTFATDLDRGSLITEFFSPDGTVFYARESIRSSCFLPVGTPDNRLGAMFISFKDRTEFDKVKQYTITSLVNQMVPTLATIRHHYIMNESFGKPALSLHNLASRHALKVGVLETARSLQTKCELAKRNQCTLSKECKLAQVFKRVDLYMADVSLVESTIPPDFRSTTLRNELKNYKEKSVSGRPIRLNLDIDIDYRRIERESPWVQLVLYSLITEAVNNAIFHGNSNRVGVKVVRESKSIDLLVKNNGIPLPTDAESRQSKHGIYFQLDELKANLGAKADLTTAPDGDGVHLNASIPALPLVSGGAEKGWNF